jgi:hypothetical protein
LSTLATVIGYFLDGLYLRDLQEPSANFTDDLADEMCSWPKITIQDLRKQCLPLVEVAIGEKIILEEDLAEFVREMKYLLRLEVTASLSRVRRLLPQNNVTVRDRFTEG